MGKRVWFFDDIGEHLIFIGRSTRCRIQLCGDDRVSAVHASINRVDGTVVLRDHLSTNGIWVDGQRVTATVVLRVGMMLRIGHSELVAVDAAGLCPLPARTLSDFCRWSWRVYGSHPQAAELVGSGMSREFMRNMSQPKERRR